MKVLTNFKYFILIITVLGVYVISFHPQNALCGLLLPYIFLMDRMRCNFTTCYFTTNYWVVKYSNSVFFYCQAHNFSLIPPCPLKAVHKYFTQVAESSPRNSIFRASFFSSCSLLLSLAFSLMPSGTEACALSPFSYLIQRHFSLGVNLSRQKGEECPLP